MQKIDFKDAIIIVKEAIRKAVRTLKILPTMGYRLDMKQSFIDALCQSQKEKLLKIVPLAKDIDFMDKVFLEFFKPLSKDEKYIVIAHAAGIKRTSIALKLCITRQAVHQKYERALSKILDYIIRNNSFAF